MTIKELLYARYEASMVCYYENTNARFKGEAEAYQDCIKLVEPIIERLEMLEQENKELKEKLQLTETARQLIYNELKCCSGMSEYIEKLKKDIKNEIELLIERRFNAYACDDYETHNILNTIIEELREVLNDE